MRWIDRAALAVLIAGYLAGRVAGWVSGRIAGDFNDSFTYVRRAGSLLDRGPVVSFTGDAPRLWGLPAFYALFPDDHARTLAQWGLATLAWIGLACAVWFALRHLAVRVLAVLALFVVALALPVVNYDLAILSESLSISLGVAVTAFGLHWARTRAWWALVGLTATAFWWIFLRPDIRILVGILVLVLAGFAVADRRRRWAAGTAVAVLVAGCAWCTLLAPRIDAAFPRWGASGLTWAEENVAFRLMKRIYPDPAVHAAFTEHAGLPSCPAAELAARPLPDGRFPKVADFAAAYRSCPDLVAWGREHGTGSVLTVALAEPGTYLHYLHQVLPRSFTGATNYGESTAVLPPGVEAAAFPPDGYGGWLVAYLLGGGLLAALLTGAYRRRAALAWTGVVVAATAAVTQLGGMTLAGSEWERVAAQELVLFRVAGILLVAAALDTLIDRLRRHPRPAAGRGPVPDPTTPDPEPDPEPATASEPVSGTAPAPTRVREARRAAAPVADNP